MIALIEEVEHYHRILTREVDESQKNGASDFAETTRKLDEFDATWKAGLASPIFKVRSLLDVVYGRTEIEQFEGEINFVVQRGRVTDFDVRYVLRSDAP